jgi:hypothetical protein
MTATVGFLQSVLECRPLQKACLDNKATYCKHFRHIGVKKYFTNFILTIIRLNIKQFYDSII